MSILVIFSSGIIFLLYDIKTNVGRPSGTWVAFSLHIQQIVGSSLSGALAATGRPFSVFITELSKAMVCGALSMGHCTLKTPCHLSKRVG